MKPGSVVCFGEVLADFHSPESGPLEEAQSFYLTPGGAPANVAVGLARLGVPSAFVGKVGQDFLGRFLRHTLDAEGVNTEYLLDEAGASTAQAFVTNDSGGERSFEFLRKPGADSRLSPSELPQDLLKDAKMLVFGSFSLTLEPTRSTCFELVQNARKRKVPVFFDPNIRIQVWDSELEARRAIQRGINVCDVLKVSQEELLWLQGDIPQDQAIRNLLTQGPQAVLLTLGGQGAKGFTRYIQAESGAPRVQAVDTTGAGDAFLAGFLAAGWVQAGLDWFKATAQLKKMLTLGCRVGALCVTRRGAMRALPRKEDLIQPQA